MIIKSYMDKQKTILIGAVLFVVLVLVVVLSMVLSGSFKRSGLSATQQSAIERESVKTNGNGKGYSLQGVLNGVVGGMGGGAQSKKRELFTPEYARQSARKILAWMDKARIYKVRLENPTETGEFICDGGYSVGEGCTGRGKCQMRMIANNVGLIATWANYKYYEQVSRDRDVMKVIESDLSTYSNTKKISAVQPAMWNFKLVYEMWKGKELNDEQKKLSWDVLYRMQHDPVLIDPIEKEVKDLPDIPPILTFETALPNGEKPLSDQDNLYSIFSSEYAYSYLFIRDVKVEKEQPYLNTAIGLYNEAMRRYLVSNGDATLFNPYMFGIAALDLYRVTGNGSFLNTASRLADRHLNSECGDIMMLCSTRAYFYHELLKVNTKQEYLQARNSLLQRVLSRNYDSSDVGGYRIGKNAFYSENKDLDESLSYEIIPNSLFVRVLIEL